MKSDCRLINPVLPFTLVIDYIDAQTSEKIIMISFILFVTTSRSTEGI